MRFPTPGWATRWTPGLLLAPALAAVLLAAGQPSAASLAAASTPSSPVPSAATLGATAGPPAAPPGWQPTFQDTFSGTTLNRSAWGVYNGPGHGSPRSASNVSVANGQLNLVTRKIGSTWTSAGVSSARVSTQTYGMYLARVRVDPGAGVRAVGLLWPTAGWPPEVDFLEFGGTGRQAARSQDMFTNHWTTHSMQHALVSGDFTGWHTVGLVWTAQELDYTLDGRVVATMTKDVPQQPMWLGFQTGVEPARSGHAPGAGTPAQVGLHLDWVAVYHQG